MTKKLEGTLSSNLEVEVSTNSNGLVSTHKGVLAKWTSEGAILILHTNIKKGEDVFLKLRKIETSSLPSIGLLEKGAGGKVDFETRARVVHVNELDGGIRFLVRVVLVGNSRILGLRDEKSDG